MATAFATRRVMERPQPNTLRKVLLVDENAQDLRSYAEILKLQGCDVRACDSFQEGKSNLEGGSFDLVIVSQGSPAFEARPLIERAVGADCGLPVFVVTGCVTMQASLAPHDGFINHFSGYVAAFWPLSEAGAAQGPFKRQQKGVPFLRACPA